MIIKNKYLLFTIFAACFVALCYVLFVIFTKFDEIDKNRKSSDARTFFVKCLNERGAMMYGMDTCDFCSFQKNLFGDEFEKLNYINCYFDKKLCLLKGIDKFPAWEIDGKILYGVQTFDTLSSHTGCKSPNLQ